MDGGADWWVTDTTRHALALAAAVLFSAADVADAETCKHLCCCAGLRTLDYICSNAAEPDAPKPLPGVLDSMPSLQNLVGAVVRLPPCSMPCSLHPD